MARLPDVMDLGAVTPRAAKGIVSDRSGEIAAQATSDFAGNINNVVQQVAEREDKFSYASAKASLLQADLDTRKSLENDPDWTTYESRYNEAMTKQLGEASKMVRGNRDRALFQMDAKLDVERGSLEVRNQAKAKETDWGRADTDQTLEALRNSAISAPDQATSEQALQAAKDKIIGARDRGYMTEQEATNAFQSFRDSFATGKLETLPADKRIEQLNDKTSVARFLQPDVRAKLLKQAESENRVSTDEATAQVYADDALAKGLSFTDALAGTSKFSGSAREAANREIRQRFSDQQTAKALDVKAITTAGWSSVMQNGTMPPTKQLLELREKAPEEERQMRDYLLAKSRQAKADATKGAETDQHVWYGLRRMAWENPASFANLDLERSRPYLSNADFQELGTLQTAVGKADAKAMQSQQVLKSTLSMLKPDIAAAGIDLTPKEGSKAAEKTTEFYSAMTRALDSATAAKGAPLDDKEAREIGISMLREGIEQGSGFLGIGKTKKRGYEIATDPNIAPGSSFIAKPYSEIPESIRTQLISAYKAKNPNAPYLRGGGLTSDQEAEIERAYTRGVELGRFK